MKFVRSLFISAALLCCGIASASPLTIDNAYVRATPPHAKNSAAFMVINNTEVREVQLIAVNSDIAERVELHNHIMQDGLMKMREVEQINIAPQGKAELQPGGLHVMFLGLKQELREGQSVRLSLYFDNGEQIIIDAPVKKIKMHKK
ncbi:copper chaperone PCu(A)C [Psychromonas ossibalaenae]|uniref:copper chaperone PCu(A)C n=1 Tax=Psychromonas ossibalaenae TaxID=444922 RepID=UPI000378BF70|nr:copper chaperone PCu(A)C [Psychromonas ossibalaenae]